MKRLLKILFVFLALCLPNVAFSQLVGGSPSFETLPNPYHPANQSRQSSQNNGFDGWIEATIQYSSNTGHHATYTLDVAIQDFRVVAIDFGNGGYIHTGQNNSGYVYQGGELYTTQDIYGNITSMYTTVRISYQNGSWQVFNITIE